jgi:hypothetical protein
MKKFFGMLGLVAVFLLLSGQTTTQFPTYVGGLTSATQPLSGSEQLYMLQGGLSRRASVSAVYTAAPAGISQNTLNSQVVNYTIATSDCGKTIQAGTGSTGFFTITLPATTGFPTTCVVNIKNADTARGKAMVGFPADMAAILWPLQETTVAIVNNVWTTLVNPGRWKVGFSPVFVLDTVNGNDFNDGLASGTGNALKTMQQFNAIVSNQLDTNLQIISLSFATATYNNLNASFQITGGGTISLVGNGSTVNSSTSNVAAINLNCGPSTGQGFGGACGVIQGFTVTCSSGGNGVLVQTGYWIQYINMTYGACPTGAQIEVDSPLARLLLQANYTISGGAVSHLVAIGGGLIDWNSASFTGTLTGTPAFSGTFAQSTIGGQLVSFNVWSGAATGKRFQADTGGNIFTNNSGLNFFPGNSAGTFNGGFYDGQTVPDATAWTAFTPTFICGTAAITNNSARSKTLGKTTWVQFDFTITVIGSCTNNVTFTLPNTAQSVGAASMVEVALNGTLGVCRQTAGSATANCSKSALGAFLVNEHFTGSGVYENQ